MQQELANQFGYTEVHPTTGAPRDVIWCRDTIAFRLREEQGADLGREQSMNMPFLSFYRIGTILDGRRVNLPASRKGVKYERSADLKTLKKYQLVPANHVFQIEFWSNEPLAFEAAIENWYRWSAPPSELALTDTEGVEFRFPMDFQDPIDNSLLSEQFEIGRIYRATFGLTVMAFITTDPGVEFKTILTETLNIWSSVGGTSEATRAPLKTGIEQT